MPNRSQLSPLERVLAIFTDIRSGEGLTGVILFANVFLILCAYYFLKPLRDSWIAVSNIEGLSSMEVKAYSAFAQSLLLAGVATAFARLSSRVARKTLVTGSTIVCMTNLVAFWMLYPGVFFENIPYMGVVFYLWVGMFGVFIVAQFWTLAADLYAGERGTRLLPMIAIGATAGAAFGSYLIGPLVSSGILDTGTFLILANVPLALSIVLTRVADARGPLGTGEPAKPKQAPAAARKGEGHGKGAITFILSHPYLISVALVVMLANWVNTNGENLMFGVLQDTLKSQAASSGITGDAAVKTFLREGTAIYYSNFFIWVNVIALFAQAFLASRLLRYGGLGAILLLLPGIALVSYSTMAMFPILSMVRTFKIAENATDYSINKTAQQVLWLPTTSTMKFRAKPAIDSLFVRLGDGFAALTVLVGVHFLELSTKTLFIVNVALVVVWLALSVAIVRTYARMTASDEYRGLA